MAGYQEISNLETGLSVRTKINQQMSELYSETSAHYSDTVGSVDGVHGLKISSEELKETDDTPIFVDSARMLKMDSTSTGLPNSIGEMKWNNDSKSAEIRLSNDVVLQVGQENLIYVKNDEIDTITAGTVVYISGGQGNKALAKRADNITHVTADRTIGVATENISSGQMGFVCIEGCVSDLDTSSWTEGTNLYLGDSAGVLTATKPVPPKTVVTCAIVLYQHNNNGRICVHVSINHNISEASDVLISGLVDKQILKWNDTAKVFENKTIDGFNDSVLWNDYNVTSFALGAGASSPDLITFLGAGNLVIHAFDGTSTAEQLYGCIELLHDYKEGTDLRPHIHYVPTTSGAGNVKWNLEYSLASNNVTFPSTTTIAVVDTVSGIAWRHKAVEFPVISGAGLTIGTQIMFRLFRNPSDVQDTYTGDAGLLTFGLHVQIDSDGSRQIFSKQ